MESFSLSVETGKDREDSASQHEHVPVLSIVIVNWNVKELLRRCLMSIFASESGIDGLEVIVIDNASSDNSVEMIRQEFAQVQLVENRANAGFTRANNQGIRIARGKHILLLNPDTEVIGNALTVMLDYLEGNPEVGAVGPMLLNTDLSLQSSRRRFPTFRTAFIESTILQRWFRRSQLLRSYYFEDSFPYETQEVDWLVGACLLIRGLTLRDIGGLDERFFMYFEELDWCLRAKRAGWKIVYLPEVKVVHHYGQSSEKDVPHRHIFFNDSKCKFFSKHYGAVAGFVLRLFLLSTYVYQMAEEGLKFGLGHKRSLRKERLSVFFKVIRSGLRA